MKRIDIVIDEDFRRACPGFCGGALFATIHNTEHCDELWQEIEEATEWLRREFTVETVKQRSGILATRNGYKACGKDPSRYRPSNEQLCRRLLQGKELYAVSTVVDLINLASIKFGYSIGGFDLDRIVGSAVHLGIGRDGEPYEGIGRGTINIAGMPVYRDEIGGIGTPTSDNERTKLALSTHHLACFVNGYDGNINNVRACGEMILEGLCRFAGTKAEESAMTFFG